MKNEVISGAGLGDGGRGVFAEILAAWNKAMASWDIEQLLKIYDREVLFFGSQPDLYQGKDGVKSYFASIPGVRCYLTLTGEKVVMLTSGLITAAGFARFDLCTEGEESQVEARLSFALIKRDDGWKIILHHFTPLFTSI